MRRPSKTKRKKTDTKKDPRTRLWRIDPLVGLGWKAAVVQKVVRKWEPIVGLEVCADHFSQATNMERGLGLEMLPWNPVPCFRVHIQRSTDHRACFRGIWEAVAKLHSDKSKAEYWLCVRMMGTGGDEYDANDKPLLPKWDAICASIKRQGGRTFTTDALIDAAARLGLARGKTTRKTA